MQRYLVGGAVRDRLLGLPVQDRDFVVVGATVQELLAQGYIPVGRDFPVFLHPQTHEEHALARTERKTAPGYQGFVFHAAADVTLEQDLARRDLTINAMAEAEDGSVIDPFNGRADLRGRILRHVSPAFLEDPVRILRLARFSARFTDFTVAPETARLMRTMVGHGEVDALVPERVWQEFSRGLMEARPSRMVTVLRDCGALDRLLPALAQLWQQPHASGACTPAAVSTTGKDVPVAPITPETTTGDITLSQLDAAARADASLPVRLAILLQATALRCGTAAQAADTTPIEHACERLKIPGECRDLAVMTARERDIVCAVPTAAEAALGLLERCDAFRKPARFLEMLDAMLLLADAGAQETAAALCWRQVFATAQSVDAGAIAAAVRREHPGQPMKINAGVRAGRTAAVRRALSSWPERS